MLDSFGPVYKKIRTLKGFSVKEATKGICSSRFLNKFENGEVDISMSVLLDLLTRIQVTGYEFFNATFDETSYSGFMAPYIYKELHRDLSKINIDRLAHHYQLKGQTENMPQYTLKSILIKSFHSWTNPNYKMDPEEIRYVQNHLDKIETWSGMEFTLFIYFVNSFPIDYIAFYFKKLINSEIILTEEHQIPPAELVYLADRILFYLVRRLLDDSEKEIDKKQLLTLCFHMVEETEKLFPLEDELPPTFLLNIRFRKAILLLIDHQESGLQKGVDCIQLLMQLDHDKQTIDEMYEQLKKVNYTNTPLQSLFPENTKGEYYVKAIRPRF